MLRWLNRLLAFVVGRSTTVRRPVVEEIEPRILYSADVNPLLWGGIDPNATAIVAGIDVGSSAAPQTVDVQQQRRREIVFVDAAVPDAQTLIDGILSARRDSADIEVVQLRADANGLQQISDVLANERDIDTIHIVSHGESGRLWLGNGLVNSDGLRAHDGFGAWQAALDADADVLLWGCNVADGAAGEAFVTQFAASTGADVAASSNDTGSAARGGDWTLEFASGSVMPSNTLAGAGWDGVLATFTVTNTNNSGAGSLRQAILDANANAGTDIITFNIPVTDANHVYYRNNGVAGTFSAPVATTLADAAIADFDADYAAGTARSWYRITLSGNYLDVTQAVIIDGSTQAGYTTGNPVIEINAAGVTTSGDQNAIALTTGASTIRGLVINSAGDNAIEVDAGAGGSTIVGNFIGTDVSGTQARANSTVGTWGAIAIKSNNVVVGGTTAADRNLISGNLGFGIEIYNSATGALIQGNYIGTTVTGAAALGNAAAGIEIRNNAASATVGGTTAGAGNLIANNTGAGIAIVGGTSISNRLLGNAIYGNSGVGIDLSNNGVTGNDTNDSDAGPNDLLNYPVLESATTSGGNTIVTGKVTGLASTTFRIEFFGSPSGTGNASGYGDARVYLGSVTVSTDASGKATFAQMLSGNSLKTGDLVTATATVDLGGGNYGSTSEFAGNILVNQSNLMLTGSYVGDGLDNRQITGLGFRPEVVIVLPGDGVAAYLRTSAMVGDASKAMTGTTALQANRIQSMEGDGFTVGTDVAVNTSGQVYHWIAFSAGSDIDVGSYTGTGSTQTVSSLGFSPEMVWALPNSAQSVRWESSLSSNTFDFNTNDFGAAGFTGFTADGFTVDGSAPVNGSGTTNYYVAWNQNAGYFKQATYTGNAVDYRNISGVGFAPELVFVRQTSGTNFVDVKTASTGASVDATGGFGNYGQTYAGYIRALQSDGFQVSADADENGNGLTYAYFAFNQTDPTHAINTVPGAQATNEDTNLVFSTANGNAIAITDANAGAAANQVTISVTNGTLTLAGTSGLTFITGDGTADSTMTLRGTAAAINSALDGLVYAPPANYNGSATLTLATLDATLVSLNIDANLVGRYEFAGNANDTSPGVVQNGTLFGNAAITTDATRGQVLTLDGSGDYVQITGTYSNPTEITIGGWVNLTSVVGRGDFITLSDRVHIALDQTGLGVKGSVQTGAAAWTDLSSGQFIAGTGWHHVMYTYSDSGNVHTLYIDGTAVASASLAGSIYWTGAGDTYIGRHPTSGNYVNGLIDEARIYNRALSASEVAALANDIPLTDSDSVAITVTAVNDAPAATNLSAGETYTEDTPLNLTDIVISDVDSASVTATLTMSNTAAGSLNTGTSGAVTSTYNAGTGVWTASGAIANVNTLLAALTFTPAANFNSNFTIATSVSDGVAAAVTGSKAMTGTAVNDAPSATNLSAGEAYTEDTALNLTDIVISDVDIDSVTATLTLSNTAAGGLNTATSGAVTSTYNAGTGVWTASGAIADVNALLAGLTFTPAANFNSNFTIATSVSDGVAAAVTGSKAMTGTAVNDAPVVNVVSPRTTNEEVVKVFSVFIGNAITISDIDAGSSPLQLSVTASNGTVSLGSTSGLSFSVGDGASDTTMTFTGTLAAINNALDGIAYMPNVDYAGAAPLQFSLSDLGNTGSGGAQTATATQSITVLPVNDAPTATNLSAGETYTEDTALNLTDIVISDVDSASVTATLTLSNTAAGSLTTATSGAVTSTYNAGTGVWTASGAIADVNSLLAGLTFTPAANFNSNFTIATSVSDGVAAAVTGSKAMTGTAVNDAPVITSNGGGATAAASVAENITAVTTVTSSDVDGGTAVYSIVAGGDGAKFTINSSTGALAFISAPDFEAPTDIGANNIYDVTVQVADGAGGVDTQAIAVTVTDVSSTLVVTTVADTNDSGLGASFTAEQLNASRGADNAISLREAIIAANTTAGINTISFNIGGAGPHTINVLAALPVITDAVIIDGSTNPDFAGAPTVVLRNGAAVVDGLQLWGGSGGSTVRGLVIQGFSGDGIDIANSNGNTIAGNWIGLTAAGTGAAGNAAGINIWNSNNNIIGGSTAADRNVISGNTSLGITINTNNGSSTGNQIRGNYIGTSADGTAAVGNANQGVWINAAGNTVGGTVAGQGNVISGTLNWVGLELGSAASGTLIAGNRIGLNAAGTAALGNAGGGVVIASANNTVGGITAAARNVISGNGSRGLTLTGASATGNVVIGNYIGTDITGTADINGGTATDGLSGVVIDLGASNNRIGTNADGSNDAAERNIVSGNNWYGIEFIGVGTSGNVAQGNYIGTDVTGQLALGNAEGGVSFWNGASNNRVGSGAAGAGNVIAANVTGVLVANGVTNNKVQGNLIGLAADGATALGNSGAGVYFYNGASASLVSGNIIGTDADGSNDAGERNVISANYRGVAMQDAEVTGNTVAGNFIGTDATGLLDRGNTLHGVYLLNGAHTNTIGGSLASQRNVISGNNGTGIEVNGEASDGNVLRGNWIGVAADGVSALGNGGHGIYVLGGGDNTLIGGTGVNDGNWIASPTLGGIFVKGDSTGTIIQGNRIGTDLAGTANWGSGQIGILLENGASQTLVGGTVAGADNIVANAGQGGLFTAGIAVIDANSSGNVFLHNSVYSSDGLGIDLGNDGVSANDVGDADSGPNDLLNTLTLDAAVTDGSTLFVSGAYIGAPNTYYRIEVYANTSAEPSGAGEGRTFVGTVNMPLGASGSLAGSYSFAGVVPVGSYISVTLTRTDSSYTTFYETSEYSNHIVATAPSVAPAGSHGSVGMFEDTAHTFTVTDFGFSDSDGDSLLAVHVDTLPGSGTLSLNGTALSAGSTVTAADITAGLLIYLPASDVNGSGLASFTFRVQDDGGTLGGGADTDATANTITINVAAVNDAPVITSNGGGATASVGVAENSSAVATVTSSDIDGGTAVYSITGGADAALFTINASTGALAFVATPDYEAPTDAGGNNVYDVTVQVSDGNGGSVMQAIAVSVTAVNDASPVITSNSGGATAAISVAENTGTVTTVIATDADLPAPTLTYSISGGADAARFAIDSNSGALTFVAAPDFEAPADAGADNVYDVVVQASDGAGGTDTQAIAVTVTPQNDNPPVITSNGGGASAAVSVAENQTTVTTVIATDADLPAQTLTYSITGGGDAARFTIDANTGVLAFAVAPNFESPADANADNVYVVVVQVSDGSLVGTQTLSVTVTNVNEAPVITSNGGGATASFSVAENQTAAATVTSTDVDGGTAVYSIAGGADAALFTIDASTGVLTFNGAPDAEAPADAGGNNVYDVTVQVSDGNGGSDTQAIAVTVVNVNEAPVVTPVPPDVTFVEGGSPQVIDTLATVTDADSPDFDGGVLTISLTQNGSADDRLTLGNFGSGPGQVSVSGGAVAYEGLVVGSFVGGTSGSDPLVVTFNASATQAAVQEVYRSVQFFNVSDTPSTLIRQLTIGLTDGDGGTAVAQTKLIYVLASNDVPVITSDGGGASAAVVVAESQTAVTTLTSSDADGDAVSYSLVGGADQARFTIDSVTGALSFVTAPNFESATDAGGDNVYDVIVQVADGNGGFDSQAIAVTVTNVNEAPIIISNGGGASAAVNTSENQVAVVTVASTDDDADAPSYSIGGGADAALFTIDSTTGALTFVLPPNFESPTDTGGDNVYDVMVQVADGNGGFDTQTIAVTVTNVNEAPVIASDGGGASASISAAENQTTVTTLTSTDVDGGTPSYSIIGGADAALFTIDSVTGALRFVTAPDFESPTDAGGDGIYNLTVQVADGNGGFDTQALVIGVTNVNEAPVIASNGGGASAAVDADENQSAVGTVTATDVDADTPSFSIVGGADAALFSIDSASGVLVFNSAPNFEAPADADGDNAYELTVQVADGNGGFDTQAISVTVRNVNEAPVITSNGGGASASVTIAENQTAVAAVTSTDVDSGAAQYGIAGGADASRFTIDAAAGTLSFRSAPDFEAPSDADRDNVYDLVISVADGNGGIDTQTIAVAVSGVNEAPRNIQPAAVELNEQAPAGTVVAIVTASDPDAGDLFTFTLVNDGAGRFVVDPASGRLQVAPGAILDFETTPSLSLVLRVTDAQGLRTEQTIVVTLRDVAEAPPDMLPPDLTPPPAPSPAPAPSAPPVTAVVSNTIEEIVRGNGREPAAAVTPGPFDSMMDSEPERDSRWQAQRGRSAANGAPLLVASVSFGSDGAGLGGWSEGALDGLLQPQSEGLAQRFGLFTLRGSSIETEASDSPSRASGRDADEALLAALQDPVRVASATLTAGFVWWLTRSGGLLTSILMGIPAWRHVDLLPVLAPARDDEDDDGLGADSQDDDAKPDRQDSLIDEMFSNTSRMFGESRFLT